VLRSEGFTDVQEVKTGFTDVQYVREGGRTDPETGKLLVSGQAMLFDSMRSV
jgi:hypothetical protein